MKTYEANINGKIVSFNEESLRVGNTVIPYTEMSDIKFSSKGTPTFFFSYHGRNLTLPVSNDDLRAVAYFFKIAKNKTSVTNETNNIQEIATCNQQEDKPRLKCPKCGSTNINVQLTEKTSFKQGHGCLWFICFGLFYFSWLLCKWMCKLLIVGCYWMFWGIWAKLIKRDQFRTPNVIKKMSRRHGKMYSDTVSHNVCQSCGHTWK